jgi:hypothetical protein
MFELKPEKRAIIPDRIIISKIFDLMIVILFED